MSVSLVKLLACSSCEDGCGGTVAYSYCPCCANFVGGPPSKWYRQDELSDHQASLAEASATLAAREQRIAELEQACRVAISRCELCEDGQVRRYYTNAGGYDMVPCPCCGKARAALAATASGADATEAKVHGAKDSVAESGEKQ